MIVEFRLKNFLSFKNEALFSMVASSDKLLDEHIIQSDKLKLLSSAVIYGPNASGKTNILKAIERMKFLLIHSINFLPFQEMPIVPFRLSETREDQSLFEIIFIFEGIRYRYGFEASSKKVYKEWFFYAPKGKEAMLFERNLQEFSFGTHFKGAKEIEKMVRENALMLSVSAQFNNPISGKVIEYFYNRLNVISNIRDMERADFVNFTLESILGDEQYKQNAIEFLNKADIAIKDLQVEKRGNDYVVNTKHNKYNQDGKVIGESYFDLFKEESDGTIKLFGLWAPIYDALLNGKVLIIDEPDTNLHPILSKYIVSLFHNKKTNPHGAQLIFATHDTNLLDKTFFRRDQVWFTQKDIMEVSELFSLSDYNPRNDAAFEKNYLQGRYGAVPYISGFDYVG